MAKQMIVKRKAQEGLRVSVRGPGGADGQSIDNIFPSRDWKLPLINTFYPGNPRSKVRAF